MSRALRCEPAGERQVEVKLAERFLSAPPFQTIFDDLQTQEARYHQHCRTC